MHELKTLGPELESAWRACRRHALHHCGHDPSNRMAAGDCLAAQVGNVLFVNCMDAIVVCLTNALERVLTLSLQWMAIQIIS